MSLSPRAALRFHAWLPTSIGSISEWDPDREPGRHATGVGHGLLELSARLDARGHRVTIGPETPPGVALVFHLESVWDWGSKRPDDAAMTQLLVAHRSASATTAIRGDVPLSFLTNLPRAVQVMPNRASICGPSQVWLPLLPQRGLRPRACSRRGRARSVGLLAYRFNVPSFLLGQEFQQALLCQDRWLVDRTWDGIRGEPSWHDFSGIDVVLCLRETPPDGSLLRKPPTKLINAWCAGSIPIVSDREVSCTELLRPDVDALVVSSPAEVLAALRRLDDPEFVKRLEEGGRERAQEYSRESVLDAWAGLLGRHPSPRTPSEIAALRRLELAVRGRAAARRQKAGLVGAARRVLRG